MAQKEISECVDDTEVKVARRSRSFFFTYWKTEQWHTIIEQETKNIEYAVYQTEICPDTKKEHIQAIITYKNARTLNSIHNTFKLKDQTKTDPVGWVKLPKNILKCFNYCQKEKSRKPGTTATIINPENKPSGQGHRTDWDLRAPLFKKRKMDVITEDLELVTKYERAFNAGRNIFDSMLSKKRKVETITIDANTEEEAYKILTQTKEERDIFVIDYYKIINDQVWIGYDAHPYILIPYTENTKQWINCHLTGPIRKPVNEKYGHFIPKWETIYFWKP